MKNQNSGFITKLLLLVVALVALKYYAHFDIIEWIKTDGVQKAITDGWAWAQKAFVVVKDWIASKI